MQKRFGSTLVSLPVSALAIVLSFALMLSAIHVGGPGRIRLTATSGPMFDDFSGSAGSGPNSRYWTIDPASTAGWLTGEVGTYTNSPDNIFLDGQGHLVIQALATPTGYTTARVNTLGNVNMLFGRVEARIKLPAGYALWPGFYLVGTNLPTVGWPLSGELDIAEMISDYTTFHVTLHAPRNGVDAPSCHGCTTPAANYEVPAWPPSPTDLTQDFHVYWANWQFNGIQVGIDDTTLATYTPASLAAEGQWVFNAPMYAYLQLAVGSATTGPPNATTPFPARMVVDWFRYTPNTP